MKLVLTLFFALLMIAGSYGHFFNPKLSDGFIPGFLPKNIVHILVGILELSLGILLILPNYSHKGAWAVLVLMILFLPIHLIDCFRSDPIIGSKMIAYIRLAIQILVIFMAWKLTSFTNPSSVQSTL
jgi:uncharacterized membrane protein